MIEWTNFDSVFRHKPDYTLDTKHVETIVRNRKELGGILFFDRIWMGVAQKLYPPKSNAELRSLWQKIAKAEVSDEKKQAILFYIMKDCKQSNNFHTTFAHHMYLPSRYQVLIGGLWDLDHLQYSRALEYLSDPSLTPDFSDDILLTLLTAPDCDRSLAVGYYVTVRPPLSKKETLQTYFKVLVQTNITEAYHFCNKKDTPQHKALFEELIRLVHAEEASSTKAERMITLLGLPFTNKEVAWFEDSLLRGGSSRLPGSKDSVLFRRLVTNNSIDGPGTLDRYRGQKLDDVNWDDIRTITKQAVT